MLHRIQFIYTAITYINFLTCKVLNIIVLCRKGNKGSAWFGDCHGTFASHWAFHPNGSRLLGNNLSRLDSSLSQNWRNALFLSESRRKVGERSTMSDDMCIQLILPGFEDLVTPPKPPSPSPSVTQLETPQFTLIVIVRPDSAA